MIQYVKLLLQCHFTLAQTNSLHVFFITMLGGNGTEPLRSCGGLLIWSTHSFTCPPPQPLVAQSVASLCVIRATQTSVLVRRQQKHTVNATQDLTLEIFMNAIKAKSYDGRRVDPFAAANTKFSAFSAGMKTQQHSARLKLSRYMMQTNNKLSEWIKAPLVKLRGHWREKLLLERVCYQMWVLRAEHTESRMIQSQTHREITQKWGFSDG